MAWRDRLVAPYIVLLLSPAFSLLASVTLLNSIPACEGDEPWWKFSDFELVLLPGLLDFAPLLWIGSRVAAVRKAAIIGGVIGSIRFAIPQITTLLVEATTSTTDGCDISVYYVVAALAPLMLALWVASGVVVALILGRDAVRKG
jgi:hypothetical protein